jgi:hypothetical protein
MLGVGWLLAETSPKLYTCLMLEILCPNWAGGETENGWLLANTSPELCA